MHNSNPPSVFYETRKTAIWVIKKSQYTVYWIFFKSISFHGVVQTYDANPVIKENK